MSFLKENFSVPKTKEVSSMLGLSERKCKPCEGGVKPLNREQIEKMLQEVSGWKLEETSGVDTLYRSFTFKNYYQTIAFVNVIAWMAHQENHHPDLEVSYNHCKVRYNTHAIQGLSENDFICAAKVNNLLNV